MTPRRVAIALALALLVGAAALGWARAPEVSERLRGGTRDEAPSVVARIALLRLDPGGWHIEAQAQRALWIDERVAVATAGTARVRSSPASRFAVPGAARSSWSVLADHVRTGVRLTAVSNESILILAEHERLGLDRTGRPVHTHTRLPSDSSPGVVQALSDYEHRWPGPQPPRLDNDLLVLALLEGGTHEGAPWSYADWESRIVENAKQLSRAITSKDAAQPTTRDVRNAIALVAALKPKLAAPHVAAIADAHRRAVEPTTRAAAQIAAIACGAPGRDDALSETELMAGWAWLGRALGSEAAPFHWYLADNSDTVAREFVLSRMQGQSVVRTLPPTFLDLTLAFKALRARTREPAPTPGRSPLPRLFGLLAIAGVGLLIWRRPPALAPRMAARLAWSAPLLLAVSAVVPVSTVERLLGAACLALVGVVVHAVGRACRVRWTTLVLVAFLIAAGLRLLPPLVDLSLAGWLERTATFGALAGTLAVGFAAQPPAAPRVPAHPRPYHGVIRRDVGLIVLIGGLFGANAGLNYIRIFTGGSKPRELAPLWYLAGAVIVLSAVLLQDRRHAPMRGRPIAVLEREPVRITGMGWLGVVVLGATHVYVGAQSLAGGLRGLPATHPDDAFVTIAAVASAVLAIVGCARLILAAHDHAERAA